MSKVTLHRRFQLSVFSSSNGGRVFSIALGVGNGAFWGSERPDYAVTATGPAPGACQYHAYSLYDLSRGRDRCFIPNVGLYLTMGK